MVIEMRRIDVGVDEANELLNQAGLASVNTMEILQGGWDNTNILLTLTDASKVVLKVWNANTIEEVRRVLARHCHLDGHGIPTAVPIEFLDGELVVEKEGMAWTILPFVEGGMLGTDEESLKSLGQTLARLQQIPTADCFPDDYRMGCPLFEEMFEIADDTTSWTDFLISLKKASAS